MSVGAMTWAFEQDLPPAEKLVLLALADHYNGGTGLCIPGQRLLAAQSSMSIRTVQRHLKTLEQRGLITRRARFRPEGRGRTSDAYHLHLDQGDKLSPLPDQGDRTGATKATNQDDQHDTRVRAITGREPEEEPLAAAPRKREPDLIFEAIANACGIDITQLTGTSRGQLNKAAKELKEIGATPDDVTAKAQAFRRQYEQATLTPTALAKHWPQLASATHKVKQGPATCPDCYQPLTDHDPEIHDMNAGRWT